MLRKIVFFLLRPLLFIARVIERIAQEVFDEIIIRKDLLHCSGISYTVFGMLFQCVFQICNIVKMRLCIQNVLILIIALQQLIFLLT